MNKIDELDKQRRLLRYKLMEAKLEELIKIHKEKGIEKIIPDEITVKELSHIHIKMCIRDRYSITNIRNSKNVKR